MVLGATVGLVAVAVGCQMRMLYRHASMLCVKADTFIEETILLCFPGYLVLHVSVPWSFSGISRSTCI